jgi:transcriptional regulator with XRE-family HTH domain
MAAEVLDLLPMQSGTRVTHGAGEWPRATFSVNNWPRLEGIASVSQALRVPYHVRPVSTGGSFADPTLAEFVTQLAVFYAPTGSRSELDLIRRPRQNSLHYDVIPRPEDSAEKEFPSQIRLIQKVLGISISDLSSVLGVSRQAIYKWLSGGPISDLNREKFEDIAAAANVLAPYAQFGGLLLTRRRNARGITIVQTLRSGASGQEWAEEISRVLLEEQNQRKIMSQILDSHQRKPRPLNGFGVPLLDEQD